MGGETVMKKSALFMAIMLFWLALAGAYGGKVQASDDLVINEVNFPAEWLRNLLKTKYYDLDGNGVLSGQEIEKIRVVQNFMDCYAEHSMGWEYTGATSAAIISGEDLSGKDVLDVRGLEKLVCCEILNLAEITCKNFTISACPESLTKVQLANADIDLLEVSGERIQSVTFLCKK